jgi:PAS domain S-box-containing protein
MALADLRNGVPVGFEFWITVGNAFEVFVATLGIHFMFKGEPHLTSVKVLAKYFVVAVILAPFVSALVGANASVRGGYWIQWRLWSFADALAFLTVTPAILSWVREGRAWLRKPQNCLELAGLMSLVVLFEYFAFVATGRREQPALLYSLVPLLLWAALRLGLKGVSTSMVVVVLLSSWGAAHGRGPFAQQGALTGVLSLQLYLFFAAMPFMFLAVLVEEQKRAEGALRKSEEKFSKAFRESPIALSLSRVKDHRYIEVNETFERRTGWSRDKVIGRTPLDIGLWTDFVQRDDFHRRLLNEGRVRNFEISARTKNGEVRTGLGSGELIEIDGQPCALTAVADITDLKQAEAALRESEERFRLVANTAPVMIWKSDVNQRTTYVNQPWLEFTGRSLDAELGSGWAEGVHPEDVARCLDAFAKAINQREPLKIEYRLLRRDGEYRWILDSGVPIFGPDGSFAGYIGSAIDVDELKLARESDERFRSVFECSAVGMALVGRDGRWTKVNRALCEILGFSEQELLTTTFQNLTHPDDLEADLSYATKVFTGEIRFYHMEKRYVHKQGHVIWATLTASAVPDASGRVAYGIAQVQDITARKNAEAALRREQEELQCLAGRLITVQEEERKRIARDLHDDLSQRLALLCIDLDLLHQGQLGGSETKQELERMRRETDELVLDMRRISHNQHHPQLALGLQHGVASFCHDFSRQHGIAVGQIHEGDLNQIPEMVGITLFRVLQEAMNNVAKHSGAERVTITLGVYGNQVLLRVTDQGRGFEIGVNQGLGLISMRERLRLVGGTMRVNSSPMLGTEVEAVVPIAITGSVVTASA